MHPEYSWFSSLGACVEPYTHGWQGSIILISNNNFQKKKKGIGTKVTEIFREKKRHKRSVKYC
jgi:hypothetical protein